MRTELKDVIHLYIGCEMNVLREDGHTVEKLTLNASKLVLIENDYYGGSEKIYLRPLSSMTPEESRTYHSLNKLYPATPVHHIMVEHATFETFAWLLKKQFDLFGLLETGQAIDKTKL